ncbi:MAG TPA: Ig-like domain-containing protein [Planctomycetota bacterium]
MYRGGVGFAVISALVFGSAGAQDPPAKPRAVPAPAAPASSELLLFLRPGSDPAAYAKENGLVLLHTLRSDPDAHVFAAADGPAALAHRGRARADLRVRRAYLNERLQRVRCSWEPDDPYYAPFTPPPPAPVEPRQWHLGNGAVPGVDVHLNAAWAREVTGNGVIIGIVDDGLERTHPDLAPNYVAADSYDFGQGDFFPDPVATADKHGTSVSGVAAARGGNLIGGTGAAPLAGLAGLRINFANQTTAMFVDATKYHSSATSLPLAIGVKNHSYGYSVPFIESQAERDAVEVSTASGTIHLFAAGNERGGAGQDSNKQDVQSSPDVIAVAALGSDGTFAGYSSFGANVFVTAPSSGISGYSILTTDRSAGAGYNRNGSGDGDAFTDLAYTTLFGGTSSATPLAAGIVALAKQVQPALNTRFAKHLLVRTSFKVDPTNAEWKTNAAGWPFNPNYGFGLIDADALTQQAVLYTGVTTVPPETVGPVAVAGGGIPDNNATGVSRTFALNSATPLEEILVTLDITHPYRGDLEAFLTSPSGTTCRLFSVAGDSGNDIHWTFVTNAFWGEIPNANAPAKWTLQVRDVFAQDVCTWTSFAVTARMGQLILNTVPPVVTSISRAGTNPTSAASADFTVAFSKPVTGVNAADFALTTSGVAGASVSNVSGGGSVYTVTVNTGAGDGTIRLDVADNDSIQDGAALPLGGAGAGNGNFTTGQSYTVDKTAPTVTVSKAVAQSDPVNAGPILFTAVFSEPVSGFTGADVSFAGSGAGGPLAASVAPVTAQTYTISVSGMTSTGSVVVSIPVNGAFDGANNGNAATAVSASVVYDVTPLTVTINQAGGQADPTSASPIAFQVEFSKNVSDFATGDVSLSGTAGATTAAVSGSGKSYTVAVSGMTSTGTVIASIAAGVAKDAAGNFNQAATFTDRTVVYDISPPSVTVNQAGGQGDPVNAGPILFSAVFSEAVTGFGPEDVSFAGSTAGGTLVAAVSAGPPYTVSVTGMTTPGLVVVSILAGAAVDAVGLPSGASSSLDNAVSFNPSGLAVTINRAGTQADPTNGGTIVFDVLFSEPVTGFVTGEVSFTGSTTGGTLVGNVSGTGASYTVQVTGMAASGDVVVSIPPSVAQNAATTLNSASTSTDNIVAYDVVAPTVTINQAVGQADPTNGSSVFFTVVFSETVTDFAATDVTLGGGAGATTKIVTGSGTTYTVEVGGMTSSGAVTATIAAGGAHDAAGNANLASTSTDNLVTRDVTVPTVTVNQAGGQADPTNASPILFTVTFSETVNGFTASDVSFAGSTAGGTLAALVGGPGPIYTVSVSGMSGDGTVVVSIPASAVTDGVGNLSAASSSADATVTFDTEGPTVTIEQAGGQADPTNDAPILFTVVFSEAPVGFATGDVALSGTAGATAAVVSGGPLVFTVTVTGMSATGKVTVAIPAAAATDAAGNDSEAASSLDASVTYDISGPAATVTAPAGPTNASPILFTVVFSEPVSGFAAGDVVLGGTAGPTGVLVSGGPSTYTLSVSGMTSDGTVTASVAASAAVDDAGNASAASGTASVSYDATPPTVTIDQAAGQADPASAAPVLFTAVFSQAVTGFTAADVVIGGTAGGVAAVSGGPVTWTVSVSGLTDGVLNVSLPAGAAIDAAGNASLASTSGDASVVLDSVPPAVVSLGSPTADGAYGPGDVVVVSVLFSKPVTVTGTPRLTLETGAADAAADYTDGSGTTTLTFAFTVAAGQESADLDVPSTLALTLQGGTIRNNGLDATLTLPAPGAAGSLGAVKALVVDGTPPLPGTVSDGWTGADVDVQLSRTTIAAHWTGFSDPQSGVAGYEWAIGTTAGGQQIRAFAAVGTRTQASTSAVDVVLALSTGTVCYVTVRATNGTGLTSTATSDGVTVTGSGSGPSAPAAFYATPGDLSAFLEWVASGGAAFHRVWWKPAAAPWTDATLVDALFGANALVAGLANGVAHDFRLKAVDADGNESPGLLASATPRPPVSIGGLATYATPQDALAAAVAGETVLLGQGIFAGPLTVPPGVSIQGLSPFLTSVVGTPGAPVITVQGTFPADGTSTISDLTLTTGTVGVMAGVADVLLDHVILHHLTSHGATSGGAGRLRAVSCTLMSNGGDGLRALGTASARNCVAGRNAGMGLNLPAGAAASYSAAFANTGGDFAAGLIGAGNSTAAAAFLNEAANDYRETGLSATVDAGDPADGFSREPAPNGARINQGAYGDTRWAASLTSAPASGGGGGGGGGCGATGLEFLALLLLRRRRK